MPMNATISNALMKLIGNGEFAEELRSMLETANETDEVSRAVEIAEDIEREFPPAPGGSPTPTPPPANLPADASTETPKEIIVDEKLMQQIVSALTADETFLQAVADAMQATAPEKEEDTAPPPMSAAQGQAVQQSLAELERALSSLLAQEGEVSTSRARNPKQEDVVVAKKTMATKASVTLSKFATK